MLLDRYFAAHRRLKATLPAIRNLRRLAEGEDARPLNRLIDAISGLPRQFRVSLVGTAGTGKSTLTSAWSHYEPDAGRLTWDSLTLTESNPAHAHPQARRQSLERAHAIVVAIDALEPWNPVVLEFVRKLPRTWLRKTVAAMLRSDLREKHELNAVSRHFGVEFFHAPGVMRINPVAVSSRLAALAPGAVDKDRLFRESGFAELAHALGAVIGEYTECHAKIAAALDLADQALASIGETADRMATDMEETTAMSFGLGEIVDEQEATTDSRLHPILGEVDSEFMAAVVELEDSLSANPKQSVFNANADGLSVLVKGTVDEALKEAAAIVEEDVGALWRQIAGDLRESAIDAFDPSKLGIPVWRKQRHAFLRAGQASTGPVCEAIRIGEAVADCFDRRRRLRRVSLASGFVVVGSVGIVVWLALGRSLLPPAIACPVTAAVLFALFKARLRRWREDTRQTLWDYLDEQRELLEQTLCAALTGNASIYFDSMRRRLHRLREEASRFQKKQTPALSSYAEIERAFHELRKEWPSPNRPEKPHS